MEDDLCLGLCVIKVLCLIVIAMSLHKIAYSNEYMWNPPSALSLHDQSQLPLISHHASHQVSSFNGGEPPVFWNLGDVESVNEELQNASKSTAPDFNTSNFAGQPLEAKLHKALSGQ